MMNQLIHRVRRRVGSMLAGPANAGRGLTVFPDDVFLVSYPRSGNTWTRFLIGNLMDPDNPVTFANIESRIPEIYVTPDETLCRMPRPRVLKSHEYFDPRYPRVIYVVRDPRDIAVSFYHYQVKRRKVPESCSLEEFVTRFVGGEVFSFCGPWDDHVNSWRYLRRGRSEFALLRYEDLLKDTERELAKAAAVLGVDGSPERLARAVALSSADRMRELEKAQSQSWVLTKGTRSDKSFVRRAGQGEWKEALSAKSIAEIEAAWGSVMTELGYEEAAVTRK